jgi:dsRNA-specific ribonuclease
MFIDLIREIERRIGVKTAHQMDMSSRIKHFAMLKEKLSEYGITPSDERMNDYVVALLDSDVALAEEKERFPALEQLGDAIYDLATSRLLFYNPNTVLSWNTKKSIESLHEHFTRAEAQVFVSKKMGFDKLFLHVGLPLKSIELDFESFSYEDAKDSELNALKEEKYFADSLEMIIGAICKDKGAVVAEEFVKSLLTSTFSTTLPGEVYPTKESIQDCNIDYDYWNIIFAAPYSQAQSGHEILCSSLHKALLALALGTDDKEKRRFITKNANTHSRTVGNGVWHSAYSVNWLLYDYLNNYKNALSFVLDKYSDECHEFYLSNKDDV